MTWKAQGHVTYRAAGREPGRVELSAGMQMYIAKGSNKSYRARAGGLHGQADFVQVARHPRSDYYLVLVRSRRGARVPIVRANSLHGTGMPAGHEHSCTQVDANADAGIADPWQASTELTRAACGSICRHAAARGTLATWRLPIRPRSATDGDTGWIGGQTKPCASDALRTA